MAFGVSVFTFRTLAISIVHFLNPCLPAPAGGGRAFAQSPNPGHCPEPLNSTAQSLPGTVTREPQGTVLFAYWVLVLQAASVPASHAPNPQRHPWFPSRLPPLDRLGISAAVFLEVSFLPARRRHVAPGPLNSTHRPSRILLKRSARLVALYRRLYWRLLSRRADWRSASRLAATSRAASISFRASEP